MLGHRIILDKFKSTEFIQKTFSDYSGNKLELKNSETPGEFSNILWVKYSFTYCINQRINHKGSLKYFERNLMKTQCVQICGMQLEQYLEGKF